MRALTIGGMDLKAEQWQRQPDERGGSDWSKRQWTAVVLADGDVEAAAIRAACGQPSNAGMLIPANYRRSINGALRGGPLVSCGGDLPGSEFTVGVEIGPDEALRTRKTWRRRITLTIREA